MARKYFETRFDGRELELYSLAPRDDYVVAWGDGTRDRIEGIGFGISATHAFDAPGTYRVVIRPLDAPPADAQRYTVFQLAGDTGTGVVSGSGGEDGVNIGDVARIVRTLGGDDMVWGGAGDDTIVLGSGRDRAFGGGGADRLDGGKGMDLISGEQGRDRLDGGAGDDTIYGGRHDDELIGGDGRDFLVGGPGADRISGGAEVDILVFGFDLFAGGDGYRSLDTGVGDAADVVLDFEQGSETLSFYATSWSARHFVGTAAFAGDRPTFRYDHVGEDTLVSGDADGDRIADWEIVLAGRFDLSLADFSLP